jgi:hypothetical protein
MPAIPASTRSSITLRLLLHAKEHWPQLGRLQVTYRGGFAYAAAIPPGDDEPQPLFRLRYGGSAHSFGFAVYSSATSRYEDTVLLTGSPVGTPQEALDTAGTLYAAGIPGTEPPKDLQGQPLRSRKLRQNADNSKKSAGFCSKVVGLLQCPACAVRRGSEGRRWPITGSLSHSSARVELRRVRGGEAGRL